MHFENTNPTLSLIQHILKSLTLILPKRRMLLSPIILLAAIALALRLFGLDWDQGNLFHPDERSLYMRAECMYQTLSANPSYLDCAGSEFPNDIAGMPSFGTFFDAERSPLNPHWFPLGSVLIYILVISKAFLQLFMGTVDLNDIARVGRSLTAIADTGSVVFIFFLGRRLYGQSAGLLAALFLTFSVINIQLAHFYRPEPFMLLLTLATFWSMLNVIESGRWRDHWALGIFLGLNIAFKPTGGFLIFPIGIVYMIATWRIWRFYQLMIPSVAILPLAMRGISAGLVGLITFAILEPYALLDFAKFQADLLREAEIVRTAGLVPYTIQYINTPSLLYEIQQSSIWGLGLPLGLIAWGGLFLTIIRLRRNAMVGDIILLSWLLPLLLTISLFEVKFLRYVALILPVMVLLGSRWLIVGFKWGKSNSKIFRKVILTVTVISVIATVLFALAFSTSYLKPHPAVQASEWVNSNLPRGTNLATDNHWDEGFPDLHHYSVSQIPIYEMEDTKKIASILQKLEMAEYLMIYSNRPFGSIARLPDKFPLSSRYYHLLFDGQFGYQLEKAFSRYPSLPGVTFTHDPFTRATLDKPAQLPGLTTKGLVIDLGYADENITNYDRPLVLIFRNNEHLPFQEMVNRMDSETTPFRMRKLNSETHLNTIEASLTNPFFDKKTQESLLVYGAPASTQELLFSPTIWTKQRLGGTWTSLFSEEGTAFKVHWLIWLSLIEIIGLLSLPLVVTIFRWLPDRGIPLAKTFGLVTASWLVWFGSSLGWWQFSRSSTLLVLLLLALSSVIMFYIKREDIVSLLKNRWRYFSATELLFLTAFLAFLAIRAANPDLWHPWRGGEKPMDLAYLTAIIKSSVMPPYDPWYAGGYINYYYFGHFMIALLAKMTGIVPAIAYNLAIPLIFALTLSGAFSAGYNLTESVRRTLYPHLNSRSVLAAALMASLFVGVFGNLDAASQVIQSTWNWLTGAGFSSFDYWQSSRVMSDELSITEFPFWSFLFADLHAHLLAIPFAILTLCLSLNIVLSTKEKLGYLYWFPACIFLWFSIGALAAINTWDVPVYAAIGLAAIGIALTNNELHIDKKILTRWLSMVVIGSVIAYVAFLPFHMNYDNPFTGLKLSPERTSLSDYLMIHGLWFFILISWLATENHRYSSNSSLLKSIGKSPKRIGFALVAISIMLFSISIGWGAVGTLALSFFLSMRLLTYWLYKRHEDGSATFVFIVFLIAMMFFIGVTVDVVTLANDIDRMNTVFKFYVSTWVLLGILSGVALWLLWASNSQHGSIFSTVRKNLWIGILTLLLISGLTFPVVGTQARLKDRFNLIPLTLNGAAYQESAVYTDPGPSGHAIEQNATYLLKSDAEALSYMQQNIAGSPVVLEGLTNQYRWTPRVANYTGLPVVMGWEWHQIQQRDRFSQHVLQRVEDVHTIYSTTDIGLAMTLLKRYEVEYIYIGPTERLYYPTSGLAKFPVSMQKGLDLFFQNSEVQIYRVLDQPN